MARTKKKWSYSTGERGRNRVRAFEHASGMLMLEFNDLGTRRRISLKHRNRDQAKQQAEAAAARLGRAEDLKPKDLTLGQLFEMYLGEVTPTKAGTTQKHDRRALKLFTETFGKTRTVSTLTIREWNAFIRGRREGTIAPANSHGPVRDRVIEQDLRLIMAVFNWATRAGSDRGGFLLDRNPFAGFRIPREKNPERVVMTSDEYQALLRVANEVDWRFRTALVLVHETGHRIGAVRQLRWSDVDLENRMATWRAEHEKSGFEHATPLTDEAVAVLQWARVRSAGIGEAPILPSPKDPSRPASRHLARDWWKRAERLAQLVPRKGRGWHALRRKFASDLKRIPLKTLCDLGGWKSHQTILTCYQHSDEVELREALELRRERVSAG